ncbi:hypothetical protein FRC09_009257 [Ceratobasidium sp. 395]|nr:hypothetical protein FRC09_009257 [Ceratobasidium sp. 395]
MPLRRLNLPGLTFDPNGYGGEHSDYEEDDITRSDSPEAQWTAFLTAVPNLEELELTEQDLPPGHLRLFASLLPNLQRLVLPRIWLDDVNGTFGDVNAPQSIAIRSGAFFRSQSSPRFGRTPDEPSIANAAKNLIDKKVFTWSLAKRGM